MWRVHGDSPEQRDKDRMKVKKAFESLRGRIPGMSHLEIGLDTSNVDYACDVVLVTDFETLQALEDYATNPEHLRVRDELVGVRTSRHQVDYIVE
jgi:Stress responsive A/B Barrel Domain